MKLRRQGFSESFGDVVREEALAHHGTLTAYAVACGKSTGSVSRVVGNYAEFKRSTLE